MSKEAILERIKADADSKADKIISDAKALSESRLKESREKESLIREEALSGLSDKEKEFIERKRSVALLEVKKDALAVKKGIIDQAFAKAIDKLCNLKKQDYVKLISVIIAKFAEDGDEIIISQKDKEVITDKVIADIAKSKKIKLTLSKKEGNFKGGVVLSNKGFDKNLTFETELQTMRSDLEPEIAALLFKED